MRNRLIDLGINLHGKTAGQLKTDCPQCKGKGDLSVNIDEGIYNCHKPKCQWKGTVKLPGDKNGYTPSKTYIIPEWRNNTALSDTVVQWFKGRGISQSTLMKMKITEGPEYMPQHQKVVNTIQFNYFREDILVNTKFRDGLKQFKMVANAELIFYNLNSISNTKECCITEGEIDQLSYEESGINYCLSVPNGASKGNQKLEYLDNCWERFEHIEKIYLATDNDAPGILLRNELARRLGVERCFIVDFKDCKDANEYLVTYGSIELADTIKDAKPFPIDGIVLANDVSADVDDYYEKGLSRGKTLGIGEFDDLVSFDDDGAFIMVSGIPNQGKSEMVDYLAVTLNLKYSWKFGIYSPENFPLKFHVGKLSEKIIGKSFAGNDRMTKEELNSSKNHINDNFFFIASDDENFSVDILLEKARILVLKYGIKGLIIDPWNKLEHQREKNEDKSDYISKVLDKMFNFKKKYKIHLFLIAHPTKIKKDKRTGAYEVPNLYDIADSAHFFNKPEIGMIVYRNFTTGRTDVYVQKMKFKHWGKIGCVSFFWNGTNGRYYMTDRDESNWLVSGPKSEGKEFNEVHNFTNEGEAPPF